VSRQPDAMRPGNDAAPFNAARTGVLLTTASVPEVDQLGFWREVVCRTIAGVDASPLDRKNSYAGTIQARSIPLTDRQGFDLLDVRADPQRVNRTRHLINAQTEGAWLLMIQKKGTCDISQGSARITLAPGAIGFLDTSRPYEVMFPKAFAQSIVKLPTLLFRDLLPRGRDIAGTALPGGDALTAIARYNLILLERLASAIDPRLLPAVANRAIDHLALAARALFDGTRRDIKRDAYAFHFERANLYIAEHLSDKKLSVERIADAIGISSGHLQEVFRESSGHTIADYVRQQRLAMCRRDLADASLRHDSITSIAFRWGFPESSSFSRAFRNAFRMTPRQYRQASDH
jgi:AraC-like DNA-binding protein